MRKKFLLLVGMFGVAIGAASFDTANALTNSQISGATGLPVGMSTSEDGRYIAFLSNDNTLVSGDTNNVDAFLRDTVSNTTTMLSVSTSGIKENSFSRRVMLSGNARYALISSNAGNLATGGVNGSTNVYLRDIKLGTTSLVIAGGSGISFYGEGLSEDGRFIYYSGVGGPDDGKLFVKDTVSNTTTRVDINTSGTGIAWTIQTQVDLSCDGRFAVIASGASDLVSGDTNGYTDIFLIDSMNGHIIKNLTINANGSSQFPRITCDGNHVVFYSDANNLVSTDTNSSSDLFEYDIPNDSFKLVSLDNSGNQYGTLSSATGGLSPNDASADMSLDGRYIVFSIDKLTGSTETSGQILLRDTVSNTTTALTSGSVIADRPQITYDGRTTYYAYASTTSYLQYRTIYVATSYL